MVYESDFYTTRRPYSRPYVSSYSVTWDRPITLPISSILQIRSMPPRMPYVAHKRLVTVIHTPYHTVYHGGSLIPIRIHARVRPSVLAAEINRLWYLTRPSYDSPTERYLRSKDYIYFDDEAKEIRARVDSLLRRVHVFIPRAAASDFAEEIIPERMRSGDYVRRLISGKQNEKKTDFVPISWYEMPERGNFGNLACVKYVAGKPQSVRRPYYKLADLRPSDIKNDVNFLSYYSKNREAAANALRQEKEEAVRKIEKYLIKAAEEAKSTAERKQAAEDERVKLELEEQKAWEALQIAQERVAHLDEIIEQEKAAAELEAEEEKIVAERLEAESIIQAERKIVEAQTAALLEEQKRMIIEENLEKAREKEEKEERLANVTFDDPVDEVKDVEHCHDDVVTCDITDQEKEERPYDPMTDDDTRIEEENVHEEEHYELSEDPFVEEPEGADCKAAGGNSVEGSTKIEEVTSGGEESFEWGDQEA